MEKGVKSSDSVAKSYPDIAARTPVISSHSLVTFVDLLVFNSSKTTLLGWVCWVG